MLCVTCGNNILSFDFIFIGYIYNYVYPNSLVKKIPLVDLYLNTHMDRFVFVLVRSNKFLSG